MSGIDFEELCPCGSGRSFGTCCGPNLAGEAAPTAEALMRSRYVAYLLKDESYVLRTWHRSTRPDSLELAGGPNWRSLDIRSSAGDAGADSAAVEFVARYVAGGRAGSLHEVSRFVREEGQWFYLDGEVRPDPAPRAKVGRNASCPCGSGRKFKRCCGR